MDDAIAAALTDARERFPEAIGEPEEGFGEVSADVERGSLLAVATSLRDEVPFELLADWSCVDFLGVEPPDRRFLLAAHLCSVRHPMRVRLRVWVPDGDEGCPSLVRVWPTAEFQEREIFDFFGIRFDGHPDLRRIFMPDGWEGYPQRKDYPLGGTNVVYHHGAFIPPPDVRHQPTTTTGYPGRIS